MTKVTAQLSRLRIAPRKVRLVGDAIKGKEIQEAERVLSVLVKRASHPMMKLLKSAIANARNNAKISDTEMLVVRDVRVDEGPAYRRFMPRARGSASKIKKRTSHILLTLETKGK